MTKSLKKHLLWFAIIWFSLSPTLKAEEKIVVCNSHRFEELKLAIIPGKSLKYVREVLDVVDVEYKYEIISESNVFDLDERVSDDHYSEIYFSINVDTSGVSIKTDEMFVIVFDKQEHVASVECRRVFTGP